jgi:integrase
MITKKKIYKSRFQNLSEWNFVKQERSGDVIRNRYLGFASNALPEIICFHTLRAAVAIFLYNHRISAMSGKCALIRRDHTIHCSRDTTQF